VPVAIYCFHHRHLSSSPDQPTPTSPHKRPLVRVPDQGYKPLSSDPRPAPNPCQRLLLIYPNPPRFFLCACTWRSALTAGITKYMGRWQSPGWIRVPPKLLFGGHCNIHVSTATTFFTQAFQAASCEGSGRTLTGWAVKGRERHCSTRH
jgi:hypothetical protein